MAELIIKYKNKKTLEVLKDLAKYFDFSVVVPSTTKRSKVINKNGVTIIKADSSIDTTELEQIFTDQTLDAKKLRDNAWKRS